MSCHCLRSEGEVIMCAPCEARAYIQAEERRRIAVWLEAESVDCRKFGLIGVADAIKVAARILYFR